MEKCRCSGVDGASNGRLTLKPEPTRARVSRRACRNCSSACLGQVRDPRDLTMRGHMPNRPGHYECRAQRGWRLGSLLLRSLFLFAGVPSAMALFSYAGLFSCAESEGVKV